MRRILLIIIASFIFTNCASINSVSLTPVPPERQKQVQTQKSKLIILGFNFDNNFIDSAVDDLKEQCPNGKVSGLLTKDETIYYFLFFVFKKQITATGYCVANTEPAKNTSKDKLSSIKKLKTSTKTEL